MNDCDDDDLDFSSMALHRQAFQDPSILITKVKRNKEEGDGSRSICQWIAAKSNFEDISLQLVP